MINEIKTRLEKVLEEAESYFKKDGYEVKRELDVSDIEDDTNTYLFPAISVVASDDEETSIAFGFTAEVDANGNYNADELDSDIADFLKQAKDYSGEIDGADNKCEAIKALDARISEEVAALIKTEAERTAKKEADAIKATYRQALLAAAVMAVVALVFFVVSKIF